MLKLVTVRHKRCAAVRLTASRSVRTGDVASDWLLAQFAVEGALNPAGYSFAKTLSHRRLSQHAAGRVVGSIKS